MTKLISLNNKIIFFLYLTISINCALATEEKPVDIWGKKEKQETQEVEQKDEQKIESQIDINKTEKSTIEESSIENNPNYSVYYLQQKYNGIEIDMSVTEEYSSLKKAICKLEDTTATSYSCDEEGINFLRCKSPAEAVITILKAQMGKVYANTPRLSVPFLDVDVNRLKRIEKVTSFYRHIPGFPLLTKKECPILTGRSFCPILKCGHYLSFPALIKRVNVPLLLFTLLTSYLIL